MKKLLLGVLCSFLLTCVFAQVDRRADAATHQDLKMIEKGSDSNIPDCFCCNDSIFKLPGTPQIIAPAGPLCACDVIKFSTIKCSGAKINWTVTDDKGNTISVTGNGTSSITLNYTLAMQVASGATSLTVTLEFRCGNKVVRNTIKVALKPIPKTNISFSINDDGNGNFTANATGMAPGNGNGWTLKEVNCPIPSPCNWVAGPIKWQASGNSIAIPNGVLVKGKCYVLTHYVNVCSATWISTPCTVFKATCFTVAGNSLRLMKAEPNDSNDAKEISAEMVKDIQLIKN